MKGWVDTTIRFRLIRALIESLRAFRRITNLKIVVALRTDIVERVMQETRDLSFQREKYDDYFIKMRWTRSLLLDLLRKRIRALFRRQYSPSDVIDFEDLYPTKLAMSILLIILLSGRSCARAMLLSLLSINA